MEALEGGTPSRVYLTPLFISMRARHVCRILHLIIGPGYLEL